MIKNIGLVTTSFGFGPVSKLAYIAEEIKKVAPGVVLTFVGDGIAFEYMEENKAADVFIRLDVDKYFTESIAVLSSCDHIINVMNLEILKEWSPLLPAMSLVDSLSWMWDKTPEGIQNLKNYFVQDYLIDFEKIQLFNLQKNTQIIPPITQKIDKSKVNKKNQLLVNFAGASNPFGGQDFYENYLRTHIDIVTKDFADKFDCIVFATNKKFCEKFTGEYKGNVEFRFFNHNDFIVELAQSRFVLTTPGITTTLECLFNDIDFGFLLPQNYSQALMSQYYVDKVGFLSVQPLSLYFSEYKVDRDMDEFEGVHLVKDYVSSILSNKKNEISLNLHQFMRNENKSLKSILGFDVKRTGQMDIVERILK